MALDKLPSIIEDTDFDENGLVRTGEGVLDPIGPLVPAYVGSQMGFNAPGVKYLNEFFYPELKRRNVLALCPFAACSEYLDLSKFSGDVSLDDFTAFWEAFNKIIGPVNYETLMSHAKFMVALFDGSHAADDGLCAEVAYFASKHGPVIGIRSDFRLAENIAAPLNPAVRYFLDQGPYNGQFFSGHHAYGEAFAGIEKLAKGIIESCQS